MKILFISHSYPPVRGGIEIQNFDLAHGLKEIAQVKVIANKKGQWFLPLFTPYALLLAIFIMNNYDVCLFGSGVLTPLGKILRIIHPQKKYFSVIHGLDITYIYKKGFLAKIYKLINIPSTASMNKLFMVGNATIEKAVSAGIPRRKCVFIPNGINVSNLKSNSDRKEVEKIIGKDLGDKKVIFRLGRFVPHKGTSWFIGNVMPLLPENVVLIALGNRVSKNVTGDNDDYTNCVNLTIEKKLQNRVFILVNPSDKKRNVFLNNADLVVSPNIKIHGSIEGFGINAIEAAACERIVLASNLDGLADAIKDQENGILVDPDNPDVWVNKIVEILSYSQSQARSLGIKARKYTIKHYSWDKICKKYLEEMEK